jgi:sortase (surface protein transpeptidase)
MSSHLSFEDGLQPVLEVVPQPTPLDSRFNQAERVPQSPVRVRIPSQGIDAQVVPVGITPTGEMEAPAGYAEVGWYRYGARPGEPGRAVLAGHLDSRDGPAVFFQLGSLQPGDTIEVQFGDGGEPRIFRVRELAQYPVDDAPLDDIFGPVDHPELVLITCAGEFEGAELGYSERVIVYADVQSGS